MYFEADGENKFVPNAGASVLAGFSKANAYFGNRLTHPGAWVEGEPSKVGSVPVQHFKWTEGNFFD